MFDRILVSALVLAAISAISGGWCIACGAAGALTSTDARRTYEAEDAACVAVYDSALTIDACRATVRRLWGQPPRAPQGAVPGPLLRDGGF